MTIDDIHKLLEQQNVILRGLQVRLDFIQDHVLMLETLFVFHAADPEGFEDESPEEWLKLMQDTQKTTRQKMDLIAAMRRRNPPPPMPPASQN
jgi:hypothetical protein